MSSELPLAIGRYDVTGCLLQPSAAGGGVYYACHAGVTYLIHLVARPEHPKTAELELYMRLSRDSSGLPRLVEVVEAGPHLGLVFEPVDGVTLGRLMGHMCLSEERFSDAACWHIAHELVHTLARCHSARNSDGKPAVLFHGRLGAEQVLISWDGRVFVMGLCPLLLGVELPGERVSRVSTAWFAPEFHQRAALSARSDSYGVTLLLRALLTGEDRPSPGSANAPLDALRPDLPAELTRVLDRGLAVVPAMRATCTELGRWLATVARGDTGTKALLAAVAPFEAFGALWSNRVTSRLPPSDGLGRLQPLAQAPSAASGDASGSVKRPAGLNEDPRGSLLSSSPPDSELVVDHVALHADGATLLNEELTGSSVEDLPSTDDAQATDFEGTLVMQLPQGRFGASPVAPRVAPTAQVPWAGSRTVVDEENDEPLQAPMTPRSERMSAPPRPPAPPFAAPPGIPGAGTGHKRSPPSLAPATPVAELTPDVIARSSAIESVSDPALPTAAMSEAALPENLLPEAALPAELPRSRKPEGASGTSSKRGSLFPWMLALGVVWGIAGALYFLKFGAPVWARSIQARVESATGRKPRVATVLKAPAPTAASVTPTLPTSSTALVSAEPASSASAEPASSASAAVPAVIDVTTRKPQSFEAYVTVTSSIDAAVYVHGALVGRTNQRTIARCGFRNLRLGVDPGPFWVSSLKVALVPCGGAFELAIEPTPALIDAEKRRPH